MAIVRVPDAILTYRERPAAGSHFFGRVAAACLRPEQILAGRAWIAKLPGGKLYIRRDPDETLLFPVGHPRAGQSRYRWEKQLDGSEWGYKVEGADDAG